MLVVRGATGAVPGAGALVPGPIEPDRLRAAVSDPAAGAEVVFVGTARGITDGVATRSLEYEAHEPLAEEALVRLSVAAVERFGLVACAVEHRLGRIGIGDAAVALATSAPHRAAAFAAAEWLMERIKAEVPIWKREERADGRREWIHPGRAPARRYLDNAATSWPKPPEVLAAWERAARDVGATAGRAAYAAAVAAGGIRDRARRAAARLLGADPARVALPAGGTLALNVAIHGLVRPGDHVIATAADHNATLRPLHRLAGRGAIRLSVVPCDGLGRVDPADVAAAWVPATRLVVCTHASNVTGAVQDAAAIAAVAHDRGGLLVLDAAQTLGQRPLDVRACGADVVCAPAHKWLLAPSGTGVLWARAGVEPEPLVQGGTGTASESLDMPAAFADRLEAGTCDVPALAGLAAAVEWLEARGIDAVGGRCRHLAGACAAGLRDVRGATVLAAEGGAPIVSFTIAGHDPGEVAAILEQATGVEVRSGLHCAARIHEHLGTRAGGTVRASFGPFNTEADVDALVGTVAGLGAA